jgi:DNA-binding NtrC family response regulator
MTKSALAHAANTAVESPATVHVLDDDVSLRDALDLLLPSVGLEVRTYASVQEFLDAKAHHKPSCIVLDVRLPGITGLDFQSRCDAFGVHLPIVMMTGHSDVPMSVQAMKAGAIDFLPKPFRDQDMIDAVMAAIARDRRRRRPTALRPTSAIGTPAASAYVPRSFPLAEAYQIDWSHEVVLLGGAKVLVKVAHLRRPSQCRWR